jgi:precorrin-4/cobalt-precorrin-4 C11-methyltransferase
MRIAGFGFRGEASLASLKAALEAAGGAKGLTALATAEAKAHAPVIQALADELGLELHAIPRSALEKQDTATWSARVSGHFGTGSLAEAAALADRAASRLGRRYGHRRHRNRRKRMTVHFIGAGPGAADLITLRGRDLIAACPVCLYAGSLVPEALLAHCPPGARIVNTAPMSLDQIIAEIAEAHAAGQDVARLHSGDLSVWSAMGEQLRRLRALGIPYDVTPGVPSFAAAAATLAAELTLPGVAQSVVLTRTSGRASAMPEGESLANFARTGATLAIHLSVHVLDKVIAELTPHYGADCPVAVVWRASWPDERVVRATLATLETAIGAEMERTALILVGRAIGAEEFGESRLYAGDYDRRFRPTGTEPRFPGTGPESASADPQA